MAKPNYEYVKRQKEIAKKQKKEAKRQMKAEAKQLSAQEAESPQSPEDEKTVSWFLLFYTLYVQAKSAVVILASASSLVSIHLPLSSLMKCMEMRRESDLIFGRLEHML